MASTLIYVVAYVQAVYMYASTSYMLCLAKSDNWVEALP